ncbi:flagellar assembly protein FliW [Halobacillus campisalis]|uniref:Flagellar assembly factor FliW n=1 Tax=Halobacillus campisalis TaxID=435909 RepID=A0ABW2K785_9BACI|nr:flagellar assembly protein FliW [Halobacillus campisalis]
MNIATKYFGDIEVKEDDCITFKKGIPGFESYHTFILLPVNDTSLYLALQSVDEAGVALIVTNPYLFYKNYEFDLDEKSQEGLGITKPEDVAVYTVVTVKEPFAQSTLNLQAPIIMNINNGQAKQIILNQTTYRTKHPLFTNEGGETYARP